MLATLTDKQTGEYALSPDQDVSTFTTSPPEPRVSEGTPIGVRVLAFAAVIALLYFGRLFFVTLLIGVVIAMLLEPAVRLLMRLRLPRGFASATVCTVTLVLLYFLGTVTYQQLVGFADDMPRYSQRADALVQQASERAMSIENRVKGLFPKKVEPPAPAPAPSVSRKTRNAPATPTTPAVQEVRIVKEEVPFLIVLWAFISSQSETLLMASFVPFLVYFLLAWQDHMLRSLSCFFREPMRLAVRKSWKEVANIARIYTMGNILLGLLLAGISALTFWWFGLPYALLAGLMSGFVSLLPYVGLPMAMLPPLFPAIMVYQDLGAIVFLLALVATYHLIALNLLYPKIVGASLHLNPLAVTVALMFWATIWGPMGFVLGIPITAGIKAVCDNVEGLQPYGRILGDTPA